MAISLYNKAKKAAITAAVIAYLEQEQTAKIAFSQYQPTFEISQWRIFGRQELMRGRVQWRYRMIKR